MSALDRIAVDPAVRGRHCIRGLSIRVKDVLDFLAAVRSATRLIKLAIA